MKHIVVTTDFSQNSKAGLRFAMQLASQSKAHVTIFNCIEVMKPTSWSDKKFEAYAKEEIEKKCDMLESFANDVFKSMKLKDPDYSFVVELGMNVDEHVINYAKEVKADVICSSTRGAGAVKKLFGTNASKLINNSSVPVIVVPADYRHKPITTIWYSSDMENIAPELKKVQTVAKTVKAKVQVNHYNYLLDEKLTRNKLNKIVDKYKNKETEFVLRHLDLEHSLTWFIERDIKKEKPSLVALFTKQNRSWFSRFFLGSNSAELSFATHTPLLVFRKDVKE